MFRRSWRVQQEGDLDSLLAAVQSSDFKEDEPSAFAPLFAHLRASELSGCGLLFGDFLHYWTHCMHWDWREAHAGAQR